MGYQILSNSLYKSYIRLSIVLSKTVFLTKRKNLMSLRQLFICTVEQTKWTCESTQTWKQMDLNEERNPYFSIVEIRLATKKYEKTLFDI